MIYPGTDLKFKVTCEVTDFFMSEDSFDLTVKNRWGQEIAIIKKEDCFYDREGNFYFTVEDVKTGMLYVQFRAIREDDDYDKQTSIFTDMQLLAVVGQCECGAEQHPCDCGCKDHKVHYEQVWTVSVDGEDYLCDKDGRYILTADGNRICFKSEKSKQIEDMGKVRLDTLTGDEFKQLIEGRSMDGKTNTIPEMIDVLQGINNEETTVKGDVEEQIETGVEQRKASESDIDEIFNK